MFSQKEIPFFFFHSHPHCSLRTVPYILHTAHAIVNCDGFHTEKCCFSSDIEGLICKDVIVGHLGVVAMVQLTLFIH